MVQNRQKVKVKVKVNRLPTFWRNLAIFGTFCKVNFSEKYTSNQASLGLKSVFSWCWAYLKFCQKVKALVN